MKAFYHYSSKGFSKEILFANEAEFIAGMNRIAVCLTMCKEKGMPIVLLAFCLMDNHFHFIFYGEKEYCDFFVDTYTSSKSPAPTCISNERAHSYMGSPSKPSSTRMAS